MTNGLKRKPSPFNRVWSKKLKVSWIPPIAKHLKSQSYPKLQLRRKNIMRKSTKRKIKVTWNSNMTSLLFNWCWRERKWKYNHQIIITKKKLDVSSWKEEYRSANIIHEINATKTKEPWMHAQKHISNKKLDQKHKNKMEIASI